MFQTELILILCFCPISAQQMMITEVLKAFFQILQQFLFIKGLYYISSFNFQRELESTRHFE